MDSMSDQRKAPTIVLTLVNAETFEIHVGGHVPNVDVALAMLAAASRIFDDQWRQLAVMKAMQQVADQELANSLMSPGKPQPRRPS